MQLMEKLRLVGMDMQTWLFLTKIVKVHVESKNMVRPLSMLGLWYLPVSVKVVIQTAMNVWAQTTTSVSAAYLVNTYPIKQVGVNLWHMEHVWAK